MGLERSRSDSKLFGLCGGLARSMNVDASWIRVGFIIGCIFTGGTLMFVYIIAAMVVPKEAAYPGYSPYMYVPSAQSYGFSGYEAPASASPSAMDAAVDQLEQQALAREISELRAKLARFEQQ